MNVYVNGSVKEVAGGSVTVSELLRLCDVQQPEMVSVQLNGAFVEKAQYAEIALSENDAVDFLYFMGGGGR